IHAPNFSNELFFAESEGRILAAALINFYHAQKGESAATYLHGASSHEHREMMAPHLLHWRIIQEAKKRGCGTYDFWGIDEKKWPGVTRFKIGFGGDILEYPESVDVVYKRGLYRLYRFFRKMIR
ncbi:MAG: methicillin resistance protein, partial [Parcubacteria group bacterium Gr01-1014_33]